MTYHRPVLLKESIEALDIKPEGIYLDLTFGGGGHAMAILENLREGHLLAFDQDPDAERNAQRFMSKSFTFIRSNFRHFKKYLKLHKIKEVDGILADLGISSYQIDEAERGFSTRFDAVLDMRMDKESSMTAKKILKKYSEEELHKIFGMYGEIKNARKLANAIVVARNKGHIKKVKDLLKVIEPLAPKGKTNKYFAKVFQALRIEVNDELSALKEMLESTVDALKPGGKLVVISYHSLEDRLVKNFINKGKFKGELEKDVYGNDIKPFKAVTRKPIVPGEAEIEDNSRARSAKMRIAEKI